MKSPSQIATRIININNLIGDGVYETSDDLNRLKNELKTLEWVLRTKDLYTDQEKQHIILTMLLQEYHLSLNDFLSHHKNRQRDYSESRQVYCYLCRKFTKMSYQDIGFNVNKNHSTVLYSIKNVVNLAFSDAKFNQKLKKFENFLTEILDK